MAAWKGPKPLCACHCGQRVRRWENRYASFRCVPRVSRSEGGRAARRQAAYRQRMVKYQAQVEELRRTGGTLTTEDLLEWFAQVDRRAYQAGWHCATDEKKTLLAKAG